MKGLRVTEIAKEIKFKRVLGELEPKIGYIDNQSQNI